MPFWSADHTANPNLKDPKRAFRFKVSFQGINDGGPAGGGPILWYAQSVKRPSFKISEVGHKYLNHTFYYPGRTDWETIELTLVDPVNPDVTATFADIISTAGYNPPLGPRGGAGSPNMTTMSKAKAANTLGRVAIIQMDSNGDRVERWDLWNAFITTFSLSELKYDGDELSTLQLTLRYDWARVRTMNNSVATVGSNANDFWNV